MADQQPPFPQSLLERLKAGDEAARWEFVELADQRLRGLAARILNEDFSRLKKAGVCYTTVVKDEVKEQMFIALPDFSPNHSELFFAPD